MYLSFLFNVFEEVLMLTILMLIVCCLMDVKTYQQT